MVQDGQATYSHEAHVGEFPVIVPAVEISIEA